MEVDEIQRQVSKFQRVSSNGSTTSTETSSNPQKIATNRANLELQNHGGGGAGGGINVVLTGGGGGGGDGVGRLCGWPSSRIVRVSRASGGKDRHSKVLTSKGLRDRRVRLSVSTAIQFYDLQDRLGYDQPSKAVDWLLKAAANSIDELPSLDPPFTGAISDNQIARRQQQGDQNENDNITDNDNLVTLAKSPGCSSTSETSKGSGLSLSRSENRIRARERARELVSKKEKNKETNLTRVLNPVNNLQENASFTDLLTGGMSTSASTTTMAARLPMDYFFPRSPQPSPQLIQIPQFNISSGDNRNHNNHHNHNHNHNHNQNNLTHNHHYSFLQDSFVPAVPTTAGGETGSYNLNFGMASSTTTGAPGGFSRGTLQSNTPASLLQHHHNLQRFQSASVDGSTATNLPFFMVPNTSIDHYPATGGYHLGYGGDGGGRRSEHHHKEKSKN